MTDEHCTVDNSKYRYRYYKGKRSGVRFAIPQNISNGANATEGTTEDTISTTIPNSFACLSSMWWLMFGEVLYIVRPALYAQLMSRRDQVLPIFVSVLLDLCSRVCTCQAMKKSQYQETNWVPFPNEVLIFNFNLNHFNRSQMHLSHYYHILFFCLAPILIEIGFTSFFID